MNRLAFGNTSLLFLVTALNPWGELLRLLRGLLRPDILSVEAWSVVWTVAFAVVGVGLGATAGFLLAIAFPRFAAVRASAMVLRSIHELFWALLLIQVFGLGPATGVLAIAIPYAGIFAKVFAEIIEEADLAAERGAPRRHPGHLGLCLRARPRGRRAVQDQPRNLGRICRLASDHRLEQGPARRLEHHRAGPDLARRHGAPGTGPVPSRLAPLCEVSTRTFDLAAIR